MRSDYKKNHRRFCKYCLDWKDSYGKYSVVCKDCHDNHLWNVKNANLNKGAINCEK